MKELGVGKEVLSYCNKDKSTLAHIIVTMKDDHTIGKVECKTCHATHAYKDPSKVKGKSTSKKKTKGKTRATKQSNSDMWLEAVNNSQAKSQAYSIKDKFGADDIIDHPKFGPGVVTKLIDDNKVEVIFRHDVKTLLHNKK